MPGAPWLVAGGGWGGVVSTGDLWPFTRTWLCQRISNMHLASRRPAVRIPLITRLWRSQGSLPELYFPFSCLPSRPPPCPVSLGGRRRPLDLFPGAGCINSGLRKSRVRFWKTPYFFFPSKRFFQCHPNTQLRGGGDGGWWWRGRVVVYMSWSEQCV